MMGRPPGVSEDLPGFRRPPLGRRPAVVDAALRGSRTCRRGRIGPRRARPPPDGWPRMHGDENRLPLFRPANGPASGRSEALRRRPEGGGPTSTDFIAISGVLNSRGFTYDRQSVFGPNQRVGTCHSTPGGAFRGGRPRGPFCQAARSKRTAAAHRAIGAGQRPGLDSAGPVVQTSGPVELLRESSGTRGAGTAGVGPQRRKANWGVGEGGRPNPTPWAGFSMAPPGVLARKQSFSRGPCRNRGRPLSGPGRGDREPGTSNNVFGTVPGTNPTGAEETRGSEGGVWIHQSAFRPQGWRRPGPDRPRKKGKLNPPVG